MQEIQSGVNKKAIKNKTMDDGNSDCLGCGTHLAYCGKPFTASLRCRKCGAVNLYEESQRPVRLAS
jgi:hypothetical protein